MVRLKVLQMSLRSSLSLACLVGLFCCSESVSAAVLCFVSLPLFSLRCRSEIARRLKAAEVLLASYSGTRAVMSLQSNLSSGFSMSVLPVYPIFVSQLLR